MLFEQIISYSENAEFRKHFIQKTVAQHMLLNPLLLRKTGKTKAPLRKNLTFGF